MRLVKYRRGYRWSEIGGLLFVDRKAAMSGWRGVEFASRDEVRRAGSNLHPTSSGPSRVFSTE